jgi:hypothetical protein
MRGLSRTITVSSRQGMACGDDGYQWRPADERTVMSQPPHHDQLPLPDYDHLPLGDLESRVRTQDSAGVRALLDYERAHGKRLPVIQLLERRLAALEEGAAPSGGSPLAETPTTQHAPQGGSSVGPETQGPPVNPPSHGDPTNPAQPRR